MNDRDSEVLLNYLQEILYSESVEEIPLEVLSEDAREFGAALRLLNQYIQETKKFSLDLARGILNTESPSRDNPFCWGLKSLQSNLSHLTWQTKQVAQGDYNQKVEFLGEFSESFNVMIEQLRQREYLYQQRHTEIEQRAIELQGMAFKDSITDLYNRHYCNQILDEWLERKAEFAICYLDLDHLKSVNDQFGHQEGDFYIAVLADVLKKTFRVTDVICRLGGDEFVVLLPHTELQVVEDRVQMAAERFQKFGETHGRYPMNFSYGITMVDETNTRSSTQLLNEADRLMYEWKRKKHHKR